MGVTLEGHMTQREMVARQGEQEACGALNGGQMGEGGWGRGGGGDGDDPFRCHIYTASTMPHLHFEKQHEAARKLRD
jgi:hypothetical protein